PAQRDVLARMAVCGHGLITDQMLNVGARVDDPRQARSAWLLGNPDGRSIRMAPVPASHRAHRLHRSERDAA
ncbi:MAG: hypothetical protein ACREQ5_22610, partial [Candidatus Dormibacteria bacterium]